MGRGREEGDTWWGGGWFLYPIWLTIYLAIEKPLSAGQYVSLQPTRHFSWPAGFYVHCIKHREPKTYRAFKKLALLIRTA